MGWATCGLRRGAGAAPQGLDGYLTLEWLKRWRPELRDPDVIFYHFQTYMETLLAEIENDEK